MICTNPSVVECWHAFVWSAAGGYRDIGIPSGGDVTSGQVTETRSTTGASWWAGRPPAPAAELTRSDGPTARGSPCFPHSHLSSHIYGYGQSVNLMSTTVGASMDAAIGAIQAAAWPLEGGIVKLNAGDLNPSVAVAVNDHRVIVGWSSLDCCGMANHATLWKLGPGRGASRPMTASRPASPMLSTMRGIRVARSGPVACLADRRAVLSRQLLVNCVANQGE